MATKSRLIAAAFSARLGVRIMCKDDAQQLVNQAPGFFFMEKVNVNQLQDKVVQDHLTLPKPYPGVSALYCKLFPVFYVDDDDLDPPYDYDFTSRTDDGRHFERGGYPYTRPYGWDRAALKVLNRYGDNTWLGRQGIRTDSSSGEWAVSYHGTASKNIRPISDSGYDSDKSQRQLFGPGIYSTPSPVVAAGYATAFDFNGKSYKMILQNRVNLNTSTTVPKERTGAGAAYFVTPEDDDVRPYGVCLKAV